MAKKTFIPLSNLGDDTIPPEKRIRHIDPSSEEGKKILMELRKELPEDFGKPKRNYGPGIFYHDPSRNKEKVHKAWGEEKTLKQWVEDPRSVCKVTKVLRGRLKLGWDLERALLTPYDGIYF